MTPIVKILALIYGLVLLGTFIVIVRKRTVKPVYSTLWLIISLFMLSFVLFENLYKHIAAALKIENATLLIIVGLISFLLFYVFYLSIKISELSNKIQELLSIISILEHEIRKDKASDKTKKTTSIE
jgi:hypothetical protein